MRSAYLVEALEDAVSDLQNKLEKVEVKLEEKEVDLENLTILLEDSLEENRVLKEANENLDHMLNSDIYRRKARVRRGLGEGDIV
jgi:regulator of replication initiation timing